MPTTDKLARAREAKAAKAEAKLQADVKRAVRWLHALRDEAQTRARYTNETEPRAKERARKAWLHSRDEWAAIGIPKDEALREARKLERSDR